MRRAAWVAVIACFLFSGSALIAVAIRSDYPTLDVYSGCIAGGKVTNLAAGDTPLKPCKANKGESEATFTSGDIAGAVDLLVADLQSEESARFAGDQAEANARVGGDQAEANARVGGDQAEASARNSGDTALQQQISTLQTDPPPGPLPGLTIVRQTVRGYDTDDRIFVQCPSGQSGIGWGVETRTPDLFTVHEAIPWGGNANTWRFTWGTYPLWDQAFPFDRNPVTERTYSMLFYLICVDFDGTAVWPIEPDYVNFPADCATRLYCLGPS